MSRECDRCHNPKHNRAERSCYEWECKDLSEWTPEDDMSGDDDNDLIAKTLNHMNGASVDDPEDLVVDVNELPEDEMIDFTPAIRRGERRAKKSLKARHSSFEDLKERMKRKLSARPPFPLKRKACDNCYYDKFYKQPSVCDYCNDFDMWEVNEELLAKAHDELFSELTVEMPETQEEFNEMNNVPEPLTAPEFLYNAADIMEERGKTYDSEGGERSMGKCVTAFNAITGKDLTEPEGWLLLQLLKDVRQWSRKDYHADSAEDCIAYAALKAESLQC